MPDNHGPGLTYYLPEMPRKHTVLRIPGSHTLYVGPRSCTRRHAVHASRYGNRGDVSFLFIDEADIISGSYEELIVRSVGELLEVLDPAPRIFFIAVFCIDDFLGTDEQALLARLRSEYPERQFTMEHVDPVSLDEQVNMGMRKHVNLYSFVRPVPAEEHDNGINFVGNFVSLDPECEFLTLLKQWGCGPIREIFNCKTYEEYQDLGKSRLAVVLRFMGSHSGEYMKLNLGIPYYEFTTCYDPETIARGYGDIAEMLGQPRGDYSREITLCRKDGEATAKALNGMPIAVDSDACLYPHAAARALLSFGLNVRYVFASKHSYKTDAESEKHIREHCPQITVTRAGDFTHLCDEKEEKDLLAIGADCALVLRAHHFADIWHDEGYFGFHGIHRLLALLRKSAAEEIDPATLTGRKPAKKKGGQF